MYFLRLFIKYIIGIKNDFIIAFVRIKITYYKVNYIKKRKKTFIYFLISFNNFPS